MLEQKDARPRRRPNRDVLKLVTESDLDGNCHGWDGATVFTLTNGEVWAQSAWRCHRIHLCSPAIRVWRLDASFLLEVEGVREILPVQRIF